MDKTWRKFGSSLQYADTILIYWSLKHSNLTAHQTFFFFFELHCHLCKTEPSSESISQLQSYLHKCLFLTLNTLTSEDTTSPQSSFLSIFHRRSVCLHLSFFLLKIFWHLILSDLIFVNALLDNSHFTFSISSVTDLQVTSVVAFGKGPQKFPLLFHSELLAQHTVQSLPVSPTFLILHTRKAKHEKTLKSGYNIKGAMIQRCSFRMANYRVMQKIKIC